MSLTLVTTAASPSVAQPLAEPLSSGSARMRRESKIHTLPHDVAVVADRSTEAFMKMMEAMQAELAATQRDLAAVRATLAESQERYTALAAATKAKDAAQSAQIAALASRVDAGFKASSEETSEAIKVVDDKLKKVADEFGHHHHILHRYATSDPRFGIY